MRQIVIVIVLLCACAAAANDAAAQFIGGGIALHYNPSIRAAGMGGGSAAAFWGHDPNYWANPALLGYHRGIRFEHGRTRLIPDFFDDVYFTSDRLTVGYWGVGFSMAGRPFDGLGEIELDYGEIPIVKEGPGGSGIQIGTHNPYEKIRSWSLGVSLSELVGRLVEVAGCDGPAFERYGDVALGFSRRIYEYDLAPAVSDPDLGELEAVKGDAESNDRGMLVRFTPYNSVDYPGHFPRLDSFLDRWVGGFRLDVSAGTSSKNYNDPTIMYYEGRSPIPIARVARQGWGLHAAVGFPGAAEEYLDEHGLGLVAESLTPLLSFGQAWDRLLPSVPDPDSRDRFQDTEIEQSGWELTICNVFSIRRGRMDEPSGDIHGDTSGWSLGFRFADIGGFRYDRATIPQSTVLGNVERKGYTFFVDPVELWRLLR